MKHPLRHFAALAALILLPGCVELDTVVRVSPDGSGTVEEKMILSSAVVQQMKAMAAQLGSMEGVNAEEALTGFDIVDRDRLQKRAAAMGEGVTLESLEPLTADWGEGYRALFRFSDIGKLRIDQNPSSAVPTGPAVEPAGHEYLSFRFEPGRKAVLTVTMPEEEPGGPMGGEDFEIPDDDFPAGEADGEEVAEQMREMFRDMRVSVALEIDGEIVETNATHREGARVTLMELDFGKLLENPEKFEAMQAAQPQTLEEAKEFMAELPGVKVEVEPEIKITFK